MIRMMIRTGSQKDDGKPRQMIPAAYLRPLPCYSSYGSIHCTLPVHIVRKAYTGHGNCRLYMHRLYPYVFRDIQSKGLKYKGYRSNEPVIIHACVTLKPKTRFFSEGCISPDIILFIFFSGQLYHKSGRAEKQEQ